MYQYYSKDYTLKLIPKPVEQIAQVVESVPAPVVVEAAPVAAVVEQKVEEMKAPVQAAEKKVEPAKQEAVAAVAPVKQEVKKAVEKFLPETVYFDYNSSAIGDSEKGKLDKLVLYLKATSAISVVLKGYTDNVGGADFNKNLSLARVKSASDYLKQQGVSNGQIKVKAFGLAKPADTNDTDEGKSHNRRVEVEIVKK